MANVIKNIKKSQLIYPLLGFTFFLPVLVENTFLWGLFENLFFEFPSTFLLVALAVCSTLGLLYLKRGKGLPIFFSSNLYVFWLIILVALFGIEIFNSLFYDDWATAWYSVKAIRFATVLTAFFLMLSSCNDRRMLLKLIAGPYLSACFFISLLSLVSACLLYSNIIDPGKYLVKSSLLNSSYIDSYYAFPFGFSLVTLGNNAIEIFGVEIYKISGWFKDSHSANFVIAPSFFISEAIKDKKARFIYRLVVLAFLALCASLTTYLSFIFILIVETAVSFTRINKATNTKKFLCTGAILLMIFAVSVESAMRTDNTILKKLKSSTSHISLVLQSNMIRSRELIGQPIYKTRQVGFQRIRTESGSILTSILYYLFYISITVLVCGLFIVGASLIELGGIIYIAIHSMKDPGFIFNPLIPFIILISLSLISLNTKRVLKEGEE